MTPDVLAQLAHPIVVAPMAGGVTTPALAVAVSSAGGLGLLPGGYKSPARLKADIEEVRAGTSAPFGVNLFVPDGAITDRVAVAAYRTRLAAESQKYGVELADPPERDDDGWDEKLALLLAEAPPVASFTFGCPQAETIKRLQAVGTTVVVTVTSVAEARTAADAGADALCVQGPEAGGHRASFTAASAESAIGLLPLLALVRYAVGIPIIAAGGIADGSGIAAVLSAGAVAAQLGTAFIRTPESGAHAAHKAALASDEFPDTALTRAFTGRPARSLVNRFMTTYGNDAPVAYPAVAHLTTPLRAAAAAGGDAHGIALWAGQGYRLARDAPAAEIVAELSASAAEASRSAAARLKHVPD